MLKPTTLFSAAAVALMFSAVGAHAAKPVGVSQIDTNGDGMLSHSEMQSSGMNYFAVLTADRNADGLLSKSERKMYNETMEAIQRARTYLTADRGRLAEPDNKNLYDDHAMTLVTWVDVANQNWFLTEYDMRTKEAASLVDQYLGAEGQFLAQENSREAIKNAHDEVLGKSDSHNASSTKTPIVVASVEPDSPPTDGEAPGDDGEPTNPTGTGDDGPGDDDGGFGSGDFDDNGGFGPGDFDDEGDFGGEAPDGFGGMDLL